MYKKHIASAFVAFSGLFIQSVIASTYVPCDGCSSMQMQNAALTHGVGRYVVGNIIANDVQAFRVYSGIHVNVIGPKAAASTLYVDDGNITAQETTAFSSYVGFYNAFPIGYQKQFNLLIVPPGSPIGVPNSITKNNIASANRSTAMNALTGISPMSIPAPGGGTVSYPTPGVNAYTVINGGPAQNAFLGWLGGLATFGISNTITTGLAALSVFHVTNVANLPSVSFTVTFTDGSHIGAYVDTTQQPPQMKVNPNSAVDSHGNTIPASAVAVAGNGRQNYSFSGGGNETDIGNMRNQIGGFGIDLPASQNFACTTVPDNGGKSQTRCVPY